nr:MAG TPA: hypothetical protein [Caudoviricetes sp.]
MIHPLSRQFYHNLTGNTTPADLSATRGRCGSIVGITSKLCLYTNNARRERIPTHRP